jgi:hypothetical protein
MPTAVIIGARSGAGWKFAEELISQVSAVIMIWVYLKAFSDQIIFQCHE